MSGVAVTAAYKVVADTFCVCNHHEGVDFRRGAHLIALRDNHGRRGFLRGENDMIEGACGRATGGDILSTPRLRCRTLSTDSERAIGTRKIAGSVETCSPRGRVGIGRSPGVGYLPVLWSRYR